MRKFLVGLLFTSLLVAQPPAMVTIHPESGSGHTNCTVLAPPNMTVTWSTHGWWKDVNGPPYLDPYEAWYLDLYVSDAPANTSLRIEFSVYGDDGVNIGGNYIIDTDEDGYAGFDMPSYTTFDDPLPLPWATTSWTGVIIITDVTTGNVLWQQGYTTTVEYIY